jgi:hypothetical protein
MKISKIFACALMLASLVGCAHPYVISPDMAKIERLSSAQPIKKNVAYYISPDMLNKEVETPGGGGDSVKYKPYKDIEMAFYKMLSNTFENVTVLKTPQNAELIQKNNISYVITPSLLTNSSSSSVVTWVPTKFNVDLTCTVNDASGNLVVVANVIAEGNAEFDEWKKDFPLAGKRAAEKALNMMHSKLLDAPELRK